MDNKLVVLFRVRYERVPLSVIYKIIGNNNYDLELIVMFSLFRIRLGIHACNGEYQTFKD